MPASGSDIPQELFKHIIYYLVFFRSGLYWTSELSPLEKRELAASALVSRYWADQCRPWLFQRIILRSLDDVQQLRSFLEQSFPHRMVKPISGHLETLCVVHHNKQQPWIHLIALHLLPLLSIKFCDLTLENFSEDTTADEIVESPFRSIFQNLPSSLPSSFTPYRELSLSNMVFASPTLFFKLIGELTQLENLVLRSIRWAISPESADIHFPVSLREVSVSGEGKEDIIPWLLHALLVRSPRGRPSRAIRALPGIVDQPEHDLFKDILSSLHTPQTREDGKWKLQSVRFDRHRKYQRIFFSCVSESDKYKRLSPETELVFGTPPRLLNVDTDQPRHLFIMHIFLELEQGVFAGGMDWQELAVQVPKLQYLRSVVVGFHVHDDLLMFMHTEGRRFESSEGNAKLRCAYRHAEQETWVVYGRDNTDDVNTGRKEISDI